MPSCRNCSCFNEPEKQRPSRHIIWQPWGFTEGCTFPTGYTGQSSSPLPVRQSINPCMLEQVCYGRIKIVRPHRHCRWNYSDYHLRRLWLHCKRSGTILSNISDHATRPLSLVVSAYSMLRSELSGKYRPLPNTDPFSSTEYSVAKSSSCQHKRQSALPPLLSIEMCNRTTLVIDSKGSLFQRQSSTVYN